MEGGWSSERASPKARQVLAGAREVFSEVGFERASVDLIAARAGVSKATVYHHFRDKAALFVASFSEQADALRAELAMCLSEPPSGRIAIALQAAGEKLMSVLLSPEVVALYRQTIAEAGRFPAIGQMLFERGPALVRDRIADYLGRWQEAGALRIPDARAAAVQLAMLCQGDLLLRAQLGLPTDPDDVRATVRRAVRVFLEAYGSSKE